jgi:hypothetical protein
VDGGNHRNNLQKIPLTARYRPSATLPGGLPSAQLIEAKPLLDRSTYNETVLSWFEDKPPEIKERKIKIPPRLQAR